MRVMISIDMEGIAGIATLDQTIRGGSGYPRGIELMTAEANAAIAGAFDGGATSVVIDDSHGTMDNLLHSALDQRARLVFGTPRAQCMVHGLDSSFDVVLFVGYHAPAGCHGVQAHTYSGSLTELRINGEPQSEASANALIAASVGVPVGMLTGDDVICTEARARWPEAVVVEVKKAEGFAATDSLHPAQACTLIRAGAAEAVRRAASLPRAEVPGELVVELDFTTPLHADFAGLVPTAERTSGRTVRVTLPNADSLASTLSSAYFLASIAAQQIAMIAARR
jgi:D-amino peptidase